jgi:hypothetical protein
MKRMTEYEGVMAVRGIVIGLILTVGVFWVPVSIVAIVVVTR